MPRIYTSTSDPIDFCYKCFPNETAAHNRYYYLGPGPDGRGNCYEYNADHPPYEECDYTCEKCFAPLKARDNGSMDE